MNRRGEAAEALATCVGFLVLMALWGSLVFKWGLEAERERMMDEGVKNGHARYYIDKGSKRAFEWLPRCSE